MYLCLICPESDQNREIGHFETACQPRAILFLPALCQAKPLVNEDTLWPGVASSFRDLCMDRILHHRDGLTMSIQEFTRSHALAPAGLWTASPAAPNFGLNHLRLCSWLVYLSASHNESPVGWNLKGSQIRFWVEVYRDTKRIPNIRGPILILRSHLNWRVSRVVSQGFPGRSVGLNKGTQPIKQQ